MTDIVQDIETERQLQEKGANIDNMDIMDMVGHQAVPDLTFEEFEKRRKAKEAEERAKEAAQVEA